MRDIIQHVEKLAAGQPSNQSYGTIHGRNTSVVHAEDLRLEAFLGQAAIESANALPLPSGPAKTVLLTGANGFLGRFLLLDLLERVAPHDGDVYKRQGAGGVSKKLSPRDRATVERETPLVLPQVRPGRSGHLLVGDDSDPVKKHGPGTAADLALATHLRDPV